jgi:hypothetical protein
MSKYVEQLGLRPGDRIVVPKSEWRLVEHHAIYLGQDNNGRHLIAENKIGIGVRLVSASDFFKDVIEITRVEPFRGSYAERKKVVQRSLARLGLPYHLINYNCQHFANDVLKDRKESEQVNSALFIGAVLVGIGLLYNAER